MKENKNMEEPCPNWNQVKPCMTNDGKMDASTSSPSNWRRTWKNKDQESLSYCHHHNRKCSSKNWQERSLSTQRCKSMNTRSNKGNQESWARESNIEKQTSTRRICASEWGISRDWWVNFRINIRRVEQEAVVQTIWVRTWVREARSATEANPATWVRQAGEATLMQSNRRWRGWGQRRTCEWHSRCLAIKQWALMQMISWFENKRWWLKYICLIYKF